MAAAADTSALERAEVAGEERVGLASSMNAKYSGDAITPFLTHSATPAARCRRSSVRR